MKGWLAASVVVLSLVGWAEPAAAAPAISLHLTGTPSCTDDGARSIAWEADLVGLDTFEQTISLYVVFRGRQSGEFNPNSPVDLVFEPDHFTEQYPGGSSSLQTVAHTSGPGDVIGTVQVAASAQAGDLNHPMVTNTYPASATVDLVDPCPPPVAAPVVAPTVASAAHPSVQPSFTG